MKERPILFSAPMVKAILSGAKSQTRRAMNPQPTPWADGWQLPGYCSSPESAFRDGAAIFKSKFGKPGDRLWVRETWAVPHRFDHLGPSNIPTEGVRVHYAASEERGGLRWRPSIHMCRWASRITLGVTGVRIERLQDISEADARAEGVDEWSKGAMSYDGHFHYPPDEKFKLLWGSINGHESWAANPWVWVIEFDVQIHETSNQGGA